MNVMYERRIKIIIKKSSQGPLPQFPLKKKKYSRGKFETIYRAGVSLVTMFSSFLEVFLNNFK